MTIMLNGLYSTRVLTLVVVLAPGRWWSPVEGAKILAVQTVAAKSHWNFMSGVFRSLTDVGHTVTVFTTFPDGDWENYTEVDMSKDSTPVTDIDLIRIVEVYGRPIAYYKHVDGPEQKNLRRGVRKPRARSDRTRRQLRPEV